MKIFNLLETQYNRFSESVRNYISKSLSMDSTVYSNSTIFGQIINVLSSSVQNIMLYIEDALTEQNKYTAQRKKSIWGLAALSGYSPSLGKTTGVQLKMNFIPTNVQNLNIILNNKCKLICSQNGLIYNLVLPQEAVLLSADRDTNTKHFYAVQGKFESQSFISTGGKFYTQNFIYRGNLDIDYLEVRVNGEVWEMKDSLYDMDPDGRQYTYHVGIKDGLDIIFGNNVHGRQVNNGDIIDISYLIHDGEFGAINSQKPCEFIFNDLLSDITGNGVDGNNIFKVTLSSTEPVTSGTNSEDVEQVRRMIGFNSRSMVLADAKNYKTILSKYSFCGYNRTWTEPGSFVVNSLIMKNYKLNMNDGKDYFNLKESDFRLSQAQKDSIKNSISESGRQLAGMVYNILDPDLCKYAMYIYIKPKSVNYDAEFVKNQIRQLVGNFFANVQSDIYIPKSDIMQLLKDEIDMIDGVNVYFLSERNETALQTKEYTNKISKYNPATGTYNVKTENVKLYDGENPNLGLDSHGNIYLESDEQFPVLMGGWDFLNDEGQEVNIVDPLIIVFEK